MARLSIRRMRQLHSILLIDACPLELGRGEFLWYVYMQALTHIPLKHTPDQWPIVHKGISSFCEFGEVWGIWGYVGKTIKYKCIYPKYIHVSALWNEHMSRDLQLLTLIQKGKSIYAACAATAANRTVASQKNNLAHIILTFNILKGKENLFFNDWTTKEKKTVYIYMYICIYILSSALLVVSSCCFFWDVQLTPACQGRNEDPPSSEDPASHRGKNTPNICWPNLARIILVGESWGHTKSSFTYHHSHQLAKKKDDPCHDILVGFIAVSTRYGKVRILPESMTLLLKSINPGCVPAAKFCSMAEKWKSPCGHCDCVVDHPKI